MPMEYASIAADEAPPQAATPPRIAFPDRARYPNVIILDGKVFNMERVHCDLTQSIDSLHDYYREQFNAYRAEQEKIMQDMLEHQGATELEHLARARGRGAITIPENLFDKTLIVEDGDLWVVRTVLYEPEELKSDYESIRHHGGMSTEAQRTLFAPYREGGNVVIQVRCPFKAVLMFKFSPRQNIIKSDYKSYHSLSHFDLCTNNVPADRIWGQSEQSFGQYINRINMFSMATSSIEVLNLLTRQVENVHISTFLKPENIISVTREERSTWTA